MMLSLSVISQRMVRLPVHKFNEAVNSITEPVGEVVSASITTFVAEAAYHDGSACCSETLSPRFGSFVRAESTEQNLTIIGTVYDVVTGPADASHKPAALGLTREQLKAEQPHIFALLRTEIQAIVIGYFQGGECFHYLPPRPAQVHDFVYLCTPAQVQAATSGMDFLRLLAGVSTVPADELLAAAVRQAGAASEHKDRFWIEAGQALAQLFREDYDRLLHVLKKVK